mmetsp:Transcript_103543/g.221445  ORF Transcript_103543/g.221445 Transcript_103543/m.221445 type:complete len:663 (+) Transcript_103543:138-2126(+)
MMNVTPKGAELYPAYKANIHERRAAAIIFRALPLMLLALVCVLSVYGVFRSPSLLLWVCAILNSWLWVYLVSSAIFSIIGTRVAFRKMQEYEERRLLREKGSIAKEGSSPADAASSGASQDPELAFEAEGMDGTLGGVEEVVHLIVFPNYKEDEAMLAQSLESISEAEGSHTFRVVLAMEAREAEAEGKALRLMSTFGSAFSWMSFSSHPKGLTETHNDGSVDDEVPGKASNLKWAVNYGWEECRKEGLINLDRIVLTVADADCIFHPAYFSSISKDFTSKEFNLMRANPGSKHMYTMWQAPQIAFRNYWNSPAPSRSWGYMAGVDEFGGVSSLEWAGHHMVFSGYSVTLRLAVEAKPWDGDVVAEDHHCYLRCMFYGIHATICEELEDARSREEAVFFNGLRPPVQVRPVLLPVKSTSVASEDGIVQGWLDRWQQARRHMQGVTEFSYALLATWDLLWTMPTNLIGTQLLVRLSRAILKLFCMHILPVLQSIALGVLTLDWLVHGRVLPQCPTQIMMVHHEFKMLLCGLAGAWVLVWPMFIPLGIFVVANYFYMVVSFVRPREMPGKLTIWHGEDGGTPPLLFGSVRLTMFLLVVFDVMVPMVAISVPYAFLPEVLAYWHGCIKGNRMNYVTAAKGGLSASSGDSGYGSCKPTEKKATAIA